jgi:hypothetical protein
VLADQHTGSYTANTGTQVQHKDSINTRYQTLNKQTNKQTNKNKKYTDSKKTAM